MMMCISECVKSEVKRSRELTAEKIVVEFGLTVPFELKACIYYKTLLCPRILCQKLQI